MSAEKRGETDGPFVRISLTFLVSAVNRSSRVLPALGSSVHIPFTLGPSLQSGPDPKGRRTRVSVASEGPTIRAEGTLGCISFPLPLRFRSGSLQSPDGYVRR